MSRPSDALSARLAVADATTSLFLGLGAVALLLGAAGGALGVLFGTGVTLALAYQRGWQALIPPVAVAAGLVAAVAIGAVAGLYPALRAARLAPTEALRTAG